MAWAVNTSVTYKVLLNGNEAEVFVVTPPLPNNDILYESSPGWSGIQSWIVVSAVYTPNPPSPVGAIVLVAAPPMVITGSAVKNLDSLGLGIMLEGDTSGPLPCTVSISGAPPVPGTIELILDVAGQNKVDAI